VRFYAMPSSERKPRRGSGLTFHLLRYPPLAVSLAHSIFGPFKLKLELVTVEPDPEATGASSSSTGAGCSRSCPPRRGKSWSLS
jgi:hypothetical protein